ncbi:vesicle transport protein SEC20 isoform X3 [Mustela erminea]|uniref:vesicle transport protein SEC20 isoform X3 n=1 Tax=Mustela erminea TaxID=36723 RepID=UPI001386BEBB|nr:vesicle transport protein SEC20 isoform X3 [Mustela erminea]
MGACICPFLSGPWGTWSHCLWCWDLKTCDFPVTWPQMLLTTSAVQQRTICFKPGRKTGHSEIELEQSAKEQDKESEKQVLLQEVENHKKQMLSNQTSWRKANLTCKIAIDNLEKAQLLQGGDLLRQRKTTKESLAQTSSAITESLMGISRMMSQQVQQSEEAMQTLGRKAFPGAFSFLPSGALTHPSSEKRSQTSSFWKMDLRRKDPTESLQLAH